MARADDPATTALEKGQTRTLRVFGTDERQLVTNTTQFPWSSVGLVQSIWRKSDSLAVVSTGSGALIGERVVLTAGHTVYDHDEGWADEILFVPGKNGLTEPYGRAYSVRTITQRGWVEDHDNRYDIALIVLDHSLGQQAGYFPIAVESADFFENRNLNSAGYPGESKSGEYQYHSYGTASGLNDGLIRHMLDSEPGQSGSPLWYYEPSTEVRRIVGVLTGSREVAAGGQVVDAFNVGVHINSAFADWIQETLARYDTVVQDVSTSESIASAEPVACGAGLPAAAATTMCLVLLVRLARRRRHF